MDLDLNGAAVLVTGGSKGIGKACAKALLAEGARVALLARGEEALAAAAAELGGEVFTIAADTSSTEQVDTAVAAVAEHFGRLDVVVNCAATPASSTPGGSGIDTAESDVLGEVDTKALGYLRVARAAVPAMRAAGGGRIINVAGMNARVSGSIMGAVRNIAVVAIAKSLADELGRDNIAVTVVHPGVTSTDSRELTPALRARSEANALGRTIDAAEIADIVAFLASPRATALNGAVLAADGGHVGSIWN